MQASRLHFCINNLPGPTNRKGGQIISADSCEYNKAGRIITETEQKDSKTIVTGLAYDKVGQLTGYTENDGKPLKTTSYTYNAAGRRG